MGALVTWAWGEQQPEPESRDIGVVFESGPHPDFANISLIKVLWTGCATPRSKAGTQAMKWPAARKHMRVVG